MITCIINNNISNEFIPSKKFFEDWLSAIDYKESAQVNIKIITPEEMKKFNSKYRNLNKITDTLAFPLEKILIDNKIILGDIAMCAKKINDDADLYNKNRIDRWAHLLIHSTLHLLGYSHNNKNNQKIMEEKEISILRKFKIFNPYEL
ncbi:MAG: rRNA maturation RNase YbeY [Gammaproteobacteria bacterium]